MVGAKTFEDLAMAIETVKIPKKFADICALIRDGQPDGIEKLNAYQGLEHQKTAVLAEVAYFDGEFERAIQLDKEICPYWNEWHYSNVREEHVAAMSFVAKLLGREKEIIDFFEEQIALLEAFDVPEHIKNAQKRYYEIEAEYLQTGNLIDEVYQPVENPFPLEQLRDAVIKEDKKLDTDSKKGRFKLFSRSCSRGSLEDMLRLYEAIADDNLSTQWHIKALSAYHAQSNEEKALEVVLRMARQRLWVVAAATQVRLMEFFTHPAVFPFLKDKDRLDKIVSALRP
jgi:hypothetical protein